MTHTPREAAEAMRETLTKLSNEVYGSLGMASAEGGIRREIGNTNYNCLMQRAQEARALLALPANPSEPIAEGQETQRIPLTKFHPGLFAKDRRDELGAVVRVAWVRWAKQQPNPKAHWLIDYADISEEDKEADRQIGETVESWIVNMSEKEVVTLRADLARMKTAMEEAFDVLSYVKRGGHTPTLADKGLAILAAALKGT